MSEWRGIESAPKDGAEFLAYWPNQWDNDSWNMERTWFCNGKWHTPNSCEDELTPWQPTHWQPLPPAPN